MIWVKPTWKTSPGDDVLVDVTAPPELSVAVGTVHVTTALVVPKGTERATSEGQLAMEGEVASKMSYCKTQHEEEHYKYVDMVSRLISFPAQIVFSKCTIIASS